jgi:hypothetical protein
MPRALAQPVARLATCEELTLLTVRDETVTGTVIRAQRMIMLSGLCVMGHNRLTSSPYEGESIRARLHEPYRSAPSARG